VSDGGSPSGTMDLWRGGRARPDLFAFRQETAFREEAGYYAKNRGRASLAWLGRSRKTSIN